MLPRCRPVVVVIACLAQAACSTGRPRKQEAPRPRLMGSVSMVNPTLGFVLIDSFENPPTGTPLRSLSETGVETATLKVSPERKSPFIIADVVKGEPHSGDHVVTVLPAAP